MDNFTLEGPTVLIDVFIKELGIQHKNPDMIGQKRYITGSKRKDVNKNLISTIKRLSINHYVLPEDWYSALTYARCYFGLKPIHDLNVWYYGKKGTITFIFIRRETGYESYCVNKYVGVMSHDFNKLDTNLCFRATHDEIFKILKKVAISKGFIKGALYNTLNEHVGSPFRKVNSYDYSMESGILCSGYDQNGSTPELRYGGHIYDNGKWADIIKK